MWDPTVEDFEVIMAARDAQLHDDISKLPNGYMHKLSSGGKNLSGGQRQRMEIARVLVQDPMIVIMDEATSVEDFLGRGSIHDDAAPLYDELIEQGGFFAELVERQQLNTTN